MPGPRGVRNMASSPKKKKNVGKTQHQQSAKMIKTESADCKKRKMEDGAFIKTTFIRKC